jgi:excisionase family DNA binding protein
MTTKLLTVKEVAERLNAPERFVRHLLSERKLPKVKLGHNVRIEESEVEAFIEAGRQEAAS